VARVHPGGGDVPGRLAAPDRRAAAELDPGWIWLGIKTFIMVTMFLWVRATFPRFRYDQIMRLGWKIFIPVTLVWLIVIGAWMQTPYNTFASQSKAMAAAPTPWRPRESAFSLKDFLSSFMLLELFKGLRVTGKYFFARKITVQFPEEKTPLSPRFPRPARAAPLRERRGTLHRLQAVRGRVPRAWRSPSRATSAPTAPAAPRATTST
jgi:hypothetical protein